jgi:hypothetical protein
VSFSYAELTEDDVEQVLDIHPAEQFAQRERSHAQFLRRKFFADPDSIDASP